MFVVFIDWHLDFLRYCFSLGIGLQSSRNWSNTYVWALSIST